jgi:hypothetical protein
LIYLIKGYALRSNTNNIKEFLMSAQEYFAAKEAAQCLMDQFIPKKVMPIAVGITYNAVVEGLKSFSPEDQGEIIANGLSGEYGEKYELLGVIVQGRIVDQFIKIDQLVGGY